MRKLRRIKEQELKRLENLEDLYIREIEGENIIRAEYARKSAKFRYELKQLKNRINESNRFYDKNIERSSRTLERFEGKYPSLSSPLGKYLTAADMKRAIKEMSAVRKSGALSKKSRKRSEANLQDYLENEGIPLNDNQMNRLYDFLEYMRSVKLPQILSMGSDYYVELATKAVRGHFSKELFIKNVEDWIGSGNKKPKLRRKFKGSSNTSFRT